MWVLFFLLLPAAWAAAIPYHPKVISETWLELPAFSKRNVRVESAKMFMEFLLHKNTEMCMKNSMNGTIVTAVWTPNVKDEMDDLFTLLANQTYIINRKLGRNWPHIVENGMNFTFRALNVTTVGSMVLYRCVKETYVFLGNDTKEVVTKPLDSWDSMIHIPFTVNEKKSFTTYVDFSLIIPKLMYYYNVDEQRSSFCLNATVNGPVDIYVKRCKSHRPVKFSVENSTKRQLVRGWNAAMKFYEKCQIGESTLPNHVEMEIVSQGHEGVGEIVAYNCFHLWRTGDDGNEFLVNTPDLHMPEDHTWKFPYSVLSFRRNSYFLPVKHILDSAAVFGGGLQMRFAGQYPKSISFSACYNSVRYMAHQEDSFSMYISRLDTMVFSQFSMNLSCKEEKTFGIYLHIATGERAANGSLFLRYDLPEPIIVPSEPRVIEDYTSVPFNLKKGQEISRNVNFRNFIQRAFTNQHLDLKMYYNATGAVQLSISRCIHSPRLKLFDPSKKGSQQFTRAEIEYLHGLDSEMNCINDLNPSRHDYSPLKNHGLILHVKALEDTFGYVIPFEERTANLIWYQLPTDYESTRNRGEYFVTNQFVALQPTPTVVAMDIKLHLDRAQSSPPTSLRLFVDCSSPCMIGFSRCPGYDVIQWKKVKPIQFLNRTYAWYSFDEEGIDYLKGIVESTNCHKKREPMLYVHVAAAKMSHVKLEFAVYEGKDKKRIADGQKNGGITAALQILGIILIAIFVIIGLGVGFLIIRNRYFRPIHNEDADAVQEIVMHDF